MLVEHITSDVSIDILLNTAGILDDYQPSLTIDLETWQRVMDTNLTPMFILSNAV